MTSLPYTAAQSDPSAWNPIPHERPQPGTSQDPAKKPKLSILEKFDRIPDDVIASIPDDVLASLHLTREDLKLSLDDRTDKMVKGFKQAKKPKLNILEKFDRISDAVIARIPDDVLASVHLTREDLKLSLDDRTIKMVKGFKQESAERKRDLPDAYEFDEPEYGPDDPLPKGYAWSSFCGDPRYKDFIVKMNCYGCGVALDHWPDDCPKKKRKGY